MIYKIQNGRKCYLAKPPKYAGAAWIRFTCDIKDACIFSNKDHAKIFAERLGLIYEFH